MNKKSFTFAFSGLLVLLRTQHNFQAHIFFGAMTLFLSWWLGISRTQWAIMILCICLVLTAEALNTSVERVVNMFSARRSWPAKWAKDIAAAGVLITAAGAVLIGLIILGPPFYQRLLKIL